MTDHDLLTIDVTSELRALGEARLRGSWQLPAELVRYAVRSGAKRIDLARGFRRIVIRWPGATIDRQVLDNLAVALDRSAPTEDRQRAISNLEASEADEILWAGAVPGALLQIDSGPTTLRYRQDSRPDLRDRIPTADAWTEIRWACRRLDRGRAMRWVTTATRFVGVDVVTTGERRPRGFENGMYYLELADPIPCRVGLTGEGVEPVVWLLRNGVVAGRAVVPGYPPFEAALELAGVVSAHADSASLRRAAQPFIAEVADHAMSMIARLVDRLDRMTDRDRLRLTEIALRAMRCGLRAGELSELPLFETFEDSAPRLSVRDLEQLARVHGNRLFASTDVTASPQFLADAATVLRVSPEACDLITRLIGVRWQLPPRRRDGPWRRLGEIVRRRVRRALRRLRGLGGGRALSDDELGPDEGRVLEALRPLLAPRSVHLGRGGGGPRRTASGFVIPSDHPAVEDARAVDEVPPYVLLLALGLGETELEKARAAWRAEIRDVSGSKFAQEMRQ